jgi:hypothetical protein
MLQGAVAYYTPQLEKTFFNALLLEDISTQTFVQNAAGIGIAYYVRSCLLFMQKKATPSGKTS